MKTSRAAQNAKTSKATTEQSNGKATNDEPKWLERTHIFLTKTSRTWVFALDGQSEIITQVATDTFALGKLKLLTSHDICPLSTTGLKELATASTVDVLTARDLNGELDIGDRFERGDYKTYQKPLIGHVSALLSRTNPTNQYCSLLCVLDWSATV